jgi:ERCC4-type nuclease
MGITAVMIDQREPEWVQALTFGGVPTLVTLLDTGDLHLAADDGTLVLVERKTSDDFLNSLADGRLFTQASNMIHLSRWSYMVITDEFRRGKGGKVFTDRETGWSWNAVQGALLSLQEMGLFVLFSAGEQDFEDCVLRIGCRKHDAALLIDPPRPAKHLTIAEAFLCGLPGMGPERAQHLMDYCGSAGRALWALTSPEPIRGVPSNVQRNTRMLLGLEEGEQLVPIVP